MGTSLADQFDLRRVLDEACGADGLDDFGDPGFLEPLGALLGAYAAAPLNDLGVQILRSGVVHSLRMRLRARYWRTQFPEIDREVIRAPVVVVGMMRTGTTLMQRLLASDPRHHCALGWEVGEVAPRIGHLDDEPDPRIAAAEAREEQTLTFAPDLFAIHPMYAHQAEEEIVFLADAFLSHVPEASADVPGYRSWIDGQDFAPAYQHLVSMLQLLQWQKRRRGTHADRWVLKTPAHLGYLDDLLAVFPDAHLVHMHRDPVATIPSGASLNTTLWRMHSDDVDPARVGGQWLERMSWANERAMGARSRWPDDDDRVTDLRFRDTVTDPIGAARGIYEAIGSELDPETIEAMQRWRQGQEGEARAAHRYTPEQFGLSADEIRGRFADYIERFDLA